MRRSRTLKLVTHGAVPNATSPAGAKLGKIHLVVGLRCGRRLPRGTVQNRLVPGLVRTTAVGRSPPAITDEKSCARGDSNPHSVTHQHLKLARLPFRHSRVMSFEAGGRYTVSVRPSRSSRDKVGLRSRGRDFRTGGLSDWWTFGLADSRGSAGGCS